VTLRLGTGVRSSLQGLHRLVNPSVLIYHTAPLRRLSGVTPSSDLDYARMKPKLQKTYTPKPADVTRDWWVMDAAGVPLGRLASEVATLLRGKHKATFAPHVDGGDYVIVVNAEKVAVTGNKESAKKYFRHSGYPGGLRELTLAEMRERYPERIIQTAVKGMLPKNKLGRRMLSRLKPYAGEAHPHGPQNPQSRDLGYTRKVDS
jgi:large subunit ribosomal protein L13